MNFQYGAKESGYAFSRQFVKPARRVPTLIEDARAGLLSPPRQLPPKYFYDDVGSALFDQISDTPEYYLTRTEAALLQARATAIIDLSLPDHIIELGSGSSRKTRHLLDACETKRQYCTYWPFDVCEPMLCQTGETLLEEYPWLNVNALVGDYLAGLTHLPNPSGRRLFVFLGSTIGNFEPNQAAAFLGELRQCMRTSDHLLLGADRHKNQAILNAAYNDAAGVTAKFNLNLLQVLNRELAANFDLEKFAHSARYNSERRQIEMHRVAADHHCVTLRALGEQLSLEAGGRILTEISRKFTFQQLEKLLCDTGFSVHAHYEPTNQYFSLLLARPD